MTATVVTPVSSSHALGSQLPVVNERSRKQLAFIVGAIVGAASVVFILLFLFAYFRRRKMRNQQFRSWTHFAPLDDDSNFAPEPPRIDSRFGYHSMLSKVNYKRMFFDRTIHLCSRNSPINLPPSQTLQLRQETQMLSGASTSTSQPPFRSVGDIFNSPNELELPKTPRQHKRSGKYYSSDNHPLRLNPNTPDTFAEVVGERTIPSPRHQSPTTACHPEGFPSEDSKNLFDDPTQPNNTLPATPGRISYSKSHLRIDNSIPSPSLYFPTNFGFEALMFPHIGRDSSKVSRSRTTKSSSVIVLPGRSNTSSVSSGTVLHATASIISRWRRTRDVIRDYDHPIESPVPELCSLAHNVGSYSGDYCERDSIAISYPKEAAIASTVNTHRRQSIRA